MKITPNYLPILSPLKIDLSSTFKQESRRNPSTIRKPRVDRCLIYMIEKICDNLFIEVENETEEFSIITSKEELFYDRDQKVDEHLFKVQNYYIDNVNPGQKYFQVRCHSLQEYLEFIGYLSEMGYQKRIKIYNNRDNILEDYEGRNIKKQIWTLEKIRNDREGFLHYISRIPSFDFDVLVDLNKLGHWRDTLKNMPGYKYSWLYIDRQPILKSDYIIK